MHAIDLRGRLGRARAVHDSNSRPCVATGLGLGLGDQGCDRGFSIATVGSVATGFRHVTPHPERVYGTCNRRIAYVH